MHTIFIPDVSTAIGCSENNMQTRNGAAATDAYLHAAAFDPGVRSKFQIVHCRTYAHSYHVFKFQGSCANSVGGDSGQDGRADGRTAEITT